MMQNVNEDGKRSCSTTSTSENTDIIHLIAITHNYKLLILQCALNLNNYIADTEFWFNSMWNNLWNNGGEF